MQRHRQRADGREGVEHAVTVGPAGVGDERPGADGPSGCEPGDERGEDIIGNREEQQISTGSHLVGRQDGSVGHKLLGAPPARLRHRGDRDRLVTCTVERGGQSCADAAGADGTNGESGRPLARRQRRHRSLVPVLEWVPDADESTRPEVRLIMPEPTYLLRARVASVTNEGRWRPWREAMADALYGPGGFYRSSGAPARHFRTSVHASPLWTDAIAELARRVDAGLGTPAEFTVVDMGAGGGELIAALAVRAPERWSLVGVDIAGRPANLPERVRWVPAPPMDAVGLIVACEWLDVVPVDVVELTGDGLRLVEVADDGSERPGPPASPEDTAWLEAWWTLSEVADRAEVGRPRDDAWARLIHRSLERGVAVAIDYAADPARDVAGTMTGYREGRQVLPVPDGSCDITAHVLMESCAASVADVEVDTLLTTQRDALRTLGVSGDRPSYGGDPQAHVAALSRAGAA